MTFSISLELKLPEVEGLDYALQNQYLQESVQQLGPEITNLGHKLRRIKRIDGELVSIVGLALIGEPFIKDVKLTYISDGTRLEKNYSIGDFYEIDTSRNPARC